MRCVEIHDAAPTPRGPRLDFDLRDILAVIPDLVLSSRWSCREVVHTAKVEGAYTEVGLARREFSGGEFTRFVAGVHQTIDGTFEARRGGDEAPWLVIRAVDSTWFEACSSDGEVLERIRRRFTSVRDAPAVS